MPIPSLRETMKGKKDGKCNRTACPSYSARWYHEDIHAYYCKACAATIQRHENDRAEAEGRDPHIMFKGIFDKIKSRSNP